AVSGGGGIVGGGVVVDSVLAIERGLVVDDRRMVAESEKDAGQRAAVDETVLDRDEFCDSDVDAISPGTGQFDSIDHPVAYRVVEQFDFDVAAMTVGSSGRVDEDLSAGVSFKCAYRAGQPGAADPAANVGP